MSVAWGSAPGPISTSGRDMAERIGDRTEGETMASLERWIVCLSLGLWRRPPLVRITVEVRHRRAERRRAA